MKYRKKPVVIEAWQFTKSNYRRIGNIPKSIKNAIRNEEITLFSQFGGDVIGGWVKTLEGEMKISENDFIIKGVDGEFYPCKPDIFEKTYEAVTNDE